MHKLPLSASIPELNQEPALQLIWLMKTCSQNCGKKWFTDGRFVESEKEVTSNICENGKLELLL